MHWMAGGIERSTSGSRWLCRLGLVVMPWLVRAFAARTFESLFKGELFYVVGGRRKYRETNRRCAGWQETSWERSSREDGTTADACWATEGGSIVSTRTVRAVRAVRWTFERRRRQSAARCDKDRKTYEAHNVVGRHDLLPVGWCLVELVGKGKSYPVQKDKWCVGFIYRATPTKYRCYRKISGQQAVVRQDQRSTQIRKRTGR
jgi:hypothetical protein